MALTRPGLGPHAGPHRAVSESVRLVGLSWPWRTRCPRRAPWRWFRMGPSSPWGPAHCCSGPAEARPRAPSPWADSCGGNRLLRRHTAAQGLTLVLTSRLGCKGLGTPLPFPCWLRTIRSTEACLGEGSPSGSNGWPRAPRRGGGRRTWGRPGPPAVPLL